MILEQPCKKCGRLFLADTDSDQIEDWLCETCRVKFWEFRQVTHEIELHWIGILAGR